MRPDFVASHRRLARNGWLVAGDRILCSRDLTQKILSARLAPERWGFLDWARHRASGGINRLSRLMKLPLGPLRRLRTKEWRHARTCNLAVWRADLERVDGFDATFNGWGREDSDLVIRLLRSGVLRKDGFFATGVLHLWHAEADRSYLQTNDERLARVLAATRIQAEQGLSTIRDDISSGPARA